MSSNVVNEIPYLRTTRLYPENISNLVVEVNRSWVDIADAVNNRTIGIFSTNKASITGESWFITSSKQQGLRQIYTFTSTADINLGFKISTIAQFTRCYGSYISGTSTYGLINGTNVAIAGQTSFYIAVNGASTTSDVIKFVVGAGAPALSSGILVVEWISNV